MRPHAAPPRHGFTLVELCVVMALAGLVAAAAWPSFRESLMRGRRADGIAALQRVQMAQESFRAQHGLYAPALRNLGSAGAPLSGDGLYRIEMQRDGADDYAVRAVPREGSAVASDTRCGVLQLVVHDALAQLRPSTRCWNQ